MQQMVKLRSRERKTIVSSQTTRAKAFRFQFRLCIQAPVQVQLLTSLPALHDPREAIVSRFRHQGDSGNALSPGPAAAGISPPWPQPKDCPGLGDSEHKTTGSRCGAQRRRATPTHTADPEEEAGKPLSQSPANPLRMEEGARRITGNDVGARASERGGFTKLEARPPPRACASAAGRAAESLGWEEQEQGAGLAPE